MSKQSRRSFLRIAGTSAVVVAASHYGLTRFPAAAREPWRQAGQNYSDPRMRALSFAILAPNPHNRQPWLVDLSVPGQVTLYCDLERLLPETDPFSRQILIGLGCFLEILRMAAAEDGYSVEILPFPDGEPDSNLDRRPISQIKFTQDQPSPDPLFEQVLTRCSTKDAFDVERSVEADKLAILRQAAMPHASAHTSQSFPQIQQLRDLGWQAHLIEVQTPRTHQESVDLIRIGKAEIEANPDGIDLGGVMLETLNRFGLFTRDQLADPQSTAFKQGLDLYREIHQTSMAYLWLVTEANSRVEQLAVGRAWVRVNLAATAQGLSIHPISQSLQEYPEMKNIHNKVHTLLEVRGGQRIQMLARLGYAPQVPPSPRWPLTTRIVSP